MLLLLAPAGCDESKPPPPPAPIGGWLGCTARSEADQPPYGAVVRMRFTVENHAAVGCWLKSLEGLVGGRFELWAGPEGGVPIPAGGEFTVDVPYRLISTSEDVLLTYLRPDPEHPDRPAGNPVVERTRVALACPEEPFDSDRLARKFDSWTWSTALQGFVYRANEWSLILVQEDGESALPSLPFRFLMDIDLDPKGVDVVLENETVRRVTAAELDEFLTELKARQARVRDSRRPDLAPYEVLR